MGPRRHRKTLRTLEHDTCELIESVNSEQSRAVETLNKLKRGDLDIAAYEDDHKFDGDGDDPA